MGASNTVRIQLAGLALVAVTVAGCGSSKPAATGSSATPSHIQASSNMVSASPSAIVWTRQQAATRYLALVAPGNALNAEWSKLGNNAPLSRYVSIARQRAGANDALARGLSAGHWPPEAQQQVQAMIPYVLRSRIAWQTVAASQTVQEVIDASNAPALNDPAAPAAATAVRIALGLPSN